MASAKPSWLDLVQRLERAVGVPLESLLRSDGYFDFLTQANRVGHRLTEAFETQSREWLALFNLPSASEIRKIREQLSRVERQLNELAKDRADAHPDERRP